MELCACMTSVLTRLVRQSSYLVTLVFWLALQGSITRS